MNSDERFKHDWRVVPSQAIFTTDGVDRVEIHCCHCNDRSFVLTRKAFSINLDDPRTWRPFIFRQGDRLEGAPG